MKYTFLFLAIILFLNCSYETQKEPVLVKNPVEDPKKLNKIVSLKHSPEFDRTECANRIKDKIKSNKPLFIHLKVPLCDNENQGIVPVNKSLGDGLNLRTNLYWGAKYGVKNYFKNISPWQLIAAYKDPSPEILERLVFYREFSNKAKVYLVADAYRGDKMKQCLIDFFEDLAGKNKDQLSHNGHTIGIGSTADLLVFNGHNGLMDYNLDYIESEDEKIKDAAVIGCISHDYFVEHLKRAKAYPFLMTTNLMAPEAYVVDAVINAWVLQKPETEIRKEAGKAYHKYQQCGLKGATRLFSSGW